MQGRCAHARRQLLGKRPRRAGAQSAHRDQRPGAAADGPPPQPRWVPRDVRRAAGLEQDTHLGGVGILAHAGQDDGRVITEAAAGATQVRAVAHQHVQVRGIVGTLGDHELHWRHAERGVHAIDILRVALQPCLELYHGAAPSNEVEGGQVVLIGHRRVGASIEEQSGRREVPGGGRGRAMQRSHLVEHSELGQAALRPRVHGGAAGGDENLANDLRVPRQRRPMQERPRAARRSPRTAACWAARLGLAPMEPLPERRQVRLKRTENRLVVRDGQPLQPIFRAAKHVAHPVCVAELEGVRRSRLHHGLQDAAEAHLVARHPLPVDHVSAVAASEPAHAWPVIAHIDGANEA
mmetsp:Transcript_78574/g.227130  ORF Transcript_78574/g.227130 Transcript_78574/m.227130 type:complete len:351 (+) Transcript_78574:297-1349(+)